jgi:hypothetical protein
LADIIVAGNTSGAITISAPLVAGSGVLTLPTGTDTLIGKATTDTLTNKTLVAPALGTPASGVLTNCTGVAAAALPAGSVLQVVQGTLSTFISTTSGTYADTGLTATITPRSTSSSILVMVNGSGYTSGAGSYAQIILVRGATTLISLNNIYGYAVSTTGVNSSMNTAYLDSPATTSATVYKVQWRRDAGAATVYLNNTSGTAPAASTSTIVLMEIQG